LRDKLDQLRLHEDGNCSNGDHVTSLPDAAAAAHDDDDDDKKPALSDVTSSRSHLLATTGMLGSVSSNISGTV